MTCSIDRITAIEPGDFAQMREESLAAGINIVNRLVGEFEDGVNRFTNPGEAIFVARLNDAICRCCGLTRDPYTPEPGVGRVRRLYVRSAHRREGIGRRLVEAVIDHARGRFGLLRTYTGDPGALTFYDRLRFERVLGAPRCSHRLMMG